MNNIEKQIEKRKYLKGDMVNKASNNLEKQRLDSFVDVQDPKTGQVTKMKSQVADRMKLKGQIQSPKMVFSVPDTSHIDWEK